MRATIKMIAEKAEVSIGTVDRVLHNRPYVKAEVRDRVLQVMEELDYHPNLMARALAMSGTPRRLMVIQPEWKGYIRDTIEEGVARFREEFSDYNVHVEIHGCPTDDPEQCLRLLNKAAETAQGIAFSASDCPEVRAKLQELAGRRIPVVTFNSDISQSTRLCYVGEDGHLAGRVAGEIAAKFLRPDDHLLLVYGGPAYAGHKSRMDGFLERLSETGFPQENCQVAATHNSYEETLCVVEKALAEDPKVSYIYMANKSVPACVEAIRRQGRSGQVRILCHDNDPEVRGFLKTGQVDFTIDQDFAYQSYQALSVLLRAITENKLPEKDCFYSACSILNAETI